MFRWFAMLLLISPTALSCSCSSVISRDSANYLVAKVLDAKLDENAHLVAYHVVVIYQFKDAKRRFKTGEQVFLSTAESSAECGSGMFVGREYWIDMSEFPTFHSCAPPQGFGDQFAIELYRRRLLENAALLRQKK